MPIDTSVLFGRARPVQFKVPSGGGGGGNGLSDILKMMQFQNEVETRNTLRSVAGVQDPNEKARMLESMGTTEGLSAAERIRQGARDESKFQYTQEKDQRDESWRARTRAFDEQHTGVQEQIAISAERRAGEIASRKSQEERTTQLWRASDYLEANPSPENVLKGIDYAEGMGAFPKDQAESYRQRLRQNPADAQVMIKEFKSNLLGMTGGQNPADAAKPTEKQTNYATYGAAAVKANADLIELAKAETPGGTASYGPDIIQGVEGTGGVTGAVGGAVARVLSPESVQLKRQAQESFKLNAGFAMSGANVGEKEQALIMRSMIDEGGDSDVIRAQKAEARQLFTESMAAGAGPLKSWVEKAQPKEQAQRGVGKDVAEAYATKYGLTLPDAAAHLKANGFLVEGY